MNFILTNVSSKILLSSNLKKSDIPPTAARAEQIFFSLSPKLFLKSPTSTNTVSSALRSRLRALATMSETQEMTFSDVAEHNSKKVRPWIPSAATTRDERMKTFGKEGRKKGYLLGTRKS
ncbi:MAG: hypothetical protein Q9223_006276 [Gallowayella weberi]